MYFLYTYCLRAENANAANIGISVSNVLGSLIKSKPKKKKCASLPYQVDKCQKNVLFYKT